MKCDIFPKGISDNVYFIDNSKVRGVKLFLIFAVLMVATLSGCTKYERQPGCHLDELNVNGNVTKIETIVKTTIPETEMFLDMFDPAVSVPLVAGNTELIFDNNGNIKKSIGYGIDGKMLYDVNFTSSSDGSNVMPSVLGDLEGKNIDDVKCEKQDGKIVNATYYSNGKRLWKQNITYDNDGNIKSIIKEYTAIAQWVKDTTLYHYYDFDSHGNWTRAVVKYKGTLARSAYEETVFRQISYVGEGSKDKLISKLSSVNEQSKNTTDDFSWLYLGKYMTIFIPEYMEIKGADYAESLIDYSDSKEQTLHYLLQSEYKNSKEAYATLSVGKVFSEVYDNPYEEMANDGVFYDKGTDDYLKDLYSRELLKQSGIRILKWMPFEIVRLSGRYVMKLSYYRYGIGSPIPVYYESYTIPMCDGYTLTVDFSYQSNLENRFKADFEKAVQSIDFNPRSSSDPYDIYEELRPRTEEELEAERAKFEELGEGLTNLGKAAQALYEKQRYDFQYGGGWKELVMDEAFWDPQRREDIQAMDSKYEGIIENPVDNNDAINRRADLQPGWEQILNGVGN